jgi:hypothetical protein
MKTRYFYITETAEDWTYRVEQVTASVEGKRRINRIEGRPEQGVVELGAFDRQVRVELQNGDVDIYMSYEYEVPDRYQVSGEASYDASSPTGSVRIVSQESYRGPWTKCLRAFLTAERWTTRSH